MKKNTLFLSVLLFVFACQNKQNTEKNSNASDKQAITQIEHQSDIPPPSKAPQFFSSATVQTSFSDSTKLFVKTANMKFRVKNVMQSTLKIEDIVVKNKGYVSLSDVKTINENSNAFKSSADSLIENTAYSIENTMQLHVPSALLDTTLREITRQCEYLHFRKISSENVAFNLIANELAIARNQKNGQRTRNAIDNRGKKLEDIVNAENSATEHDATADDAQIEKLKLFDQVKYSVIHLEIYQAPAYTQHKIANTDLSEKISFWDKTIEAFSDGFDYFKMFLLIIFRFLPLGIFALGIFLFVKKYKQR